jgi:hypothetical protein
LFISSKPQPEKRRQVKVYKLWKENNETKDFGFVDINADPRCYEADFCVVHGQDSKERPMLERIAANLVSSSEGLAIEEKQYFSHLPRVIRFYINVIVTTAKLKVCQYNPGNISVDLGTLSAADFEELPYVRFRKQLTTQHELSGELKSGGYVGVERAKQNTVFVVNAEHLIDFLSEFAIDSRAFDGD